VLSLARSRICAYRRTAGVYISMFEWCPDCLLPPANLVPLRAIQVYVYSTDASMITNTMAESRLTGDVRWLIGLATSTQPASTDAFVRLQHSLMQHVQRSINIIPTLQQHNGRLIRDNDALQAHQQSLTSQLLEAESARDKLRDDVEEGQKKIAHEDARCTVLEKQISRLENELSQARERLKLNTGTRKSVADLNDELKKELKGIQGREAILKGLNDQLNAQRIGHERERKTWESEKGVLETDLQSTKAREHGAQRDLAVRIAEVHSLKDSNQDLSQRLCAQEQAQQAVDDSRRAAEDRCLFLEDELSGATKLREDLSLKADEADQACSRARLEGLTLQKQLYDELKTAKELKSPTEGQLRELKTGLEEERTRSMKLQAQQVCLTKELADSHATVQQSKCALKCALAQLTACKKEKTELSENLDRSRLCEQHLQKALTEDSEATAVLDADCERLSQQFSLLKEGAINHAEEMMKTPRESTTA